MSPASPRGGGVGEPEGKKKSESIQKQEEVPDSAHCFFRLKSLSEVWLWYAVHTQNTSLHLKEGIGIFRQEVQPKQKNQVH